MELTAYQQEMLDGVWGKGKSMAMQVLVGIGKCFDAPRLVPITRAHVSLSAQEADLWFSGKLLAAGARCAVPPTVNPGYSLDYFGGQISEAAAENMRQVDRTYRQLGARMTYSCTPYLGDNVPGFWETVAFSETNATIFVNSVLGARTNRESAASALCAAVTGFTPEYGMLLEKNRFATVAVEVRASLSSDFDYAALGLLGKKIGKGVPAFLGLPRDISTEALIALGTQLNVSGSFDLFHIPGVTAEARRWGDVFGGKEPERRVIITREDLDKALEDFSPSPSGPIKYCILGCPHYTFSQLEEVAGLLAGRASRVPVYILTSSTVKARAREAGLEQRLQALGAVLIPGTCVDEACCWGYLAGRPGVTDSPKGAYYMETAGIQLAVRDRATCIRWAQNGRVC